MEVLVALLKTDDEEMGILAIGAEEAMGVHLELRLDDNDVEEPAVETKPAEPATVGIRLLELCCKCDAFMPPFIAYVLVSPGVWNELVCRPAPPMTFPIEFVI